MDTTAAHPGPEGDDAPLDEEAVVDSDSVNDGSLDDGSLDDGSLDDGADDEGGEADAASGDADAPKSAQDAGLLEREGELAADYLEGLLDIIDVDGDIDMDVEGERASVAVVGAELDDLVGRRGEVLDALQELTRLAVMRQTGLRSRLMLDVGGFRAKRRQQLSDVGRRTAEKVRETGEPVSLKPMTPFERKIVHDAIAGIEGVRTESEGEEPHRYVVVSLV